MLETRFFSEKKEQGAASGSPFALPRRHCRAFCSRCWAASLETCREIDLPVRVGQGVGYFPTIDDLRSALLSWVYFSASFLTDRLAASSPPTPRLALLNCQ